MLNLKQQLEGSKFNINTPVECINFWNEQGLDVTYDKSEIFDPEIRQITDYIRAWLFSEDQNLKGTVYFSFFDYRFHVVLSRDSNDRKLEEILNDRFLTEKSLANAYDEMREFLQYTISVRNKIYEN